MGSDKSHLINFCWCPYFNPRSPRGERRRQSLSHSRCERFQSTLPAWGATARTMQRRTTKSKFQSTLPAWGATPSRRQRRKGVKRISIHAPRVGSDGGTGGTGGTGGISIHAPRVGSDCALLLLYTCSLDFNPRSPRGERRQDIVYAAKRRKDFNPRSPRGERQGTFRAVLRVSSISIHAPRVGSDAMHIPSHTDTSIFQSTLPAWGATHFALPVLLQFKISIHAPRVGSDFHFLSLHIP